MHICGKIYSNEFQIEEVMVMKLLHTSDWHLGASEGERPLLEDQRFFIDEICSVIESRSVDAVLIAGDIYDRSLASAEAIKLYDYAMTKICAELNVPAYIIAGNHDSAERLSNCSELLQKSGLHIKGQLDSNISPVEINDIQLYMLPWITEEKVKSVFSARKDEIGSLIDAYNVVTDEMRKTFDPNKKHIILSHAFITDSETSTSDRSAVIGLASQVPASVFDGFDYVALGHIHKPQDVTGSIRYSGTPMPYSFGKEEKQTKSVTLIDTDTMAKEIIPLDLLHARTSFEGRLAELLHPNCTEEQRNGYVRLKVTDSHVGLELLSELRSVYPNLLEVSGKNYEGENTSVTLTPEELEKLETDPMEIFRHFCNEEIGESPSEHFMELFQAAIEDCEEGEN